MKNIAKAVLARKRIGMRKAIRKISEWLSDAETSLAFREEMERMGVRASGETDDSSRERRVVVEWADGSADDSVSAVRRPTDGGKCPEA